MTERIRTRLGTLFIPSRSSSSHHSSAKVNGKTQAATSKASPIQRSTVRAPPTPPPISDLPPDFDTSIFGFHQPSSSRPSSPTALPSRPQPTVPPLIHRSSVPLPPKIRNNSYPTPYTPSSPMLGLRPKASARPGLLMTRSERLARERTIATQESEECRTGLLNHGIKIRDFQRERDEHVAYLRSEAALRRRLEEANGVLPSTK